MDIVIYTTRKVLKHKKGGDGYQFYYWFLLHTPKRFHVNDKVYFAIEKQVVGYFICNEFNPGEKETICWNKDTWKDIIPIPTNPFRGFRYKWW